MSVLLPMIYPDLGHVRTRIRLFRERPRTASRKTSVSPSQPKAEPCAGIPLARVLGGGYPTEDVNSDDIPF